MSEKNSISLKPYTIVKLVTDRYRDQGIDLGALGTILDVYGDEAYEIEFSRDDGTTIAWFAVLQNEVTTQIESSVFPVTSQKEPG